jgi:hypothetical protein
MKQWQDTAVATERKNNDFERQSERLARECKLNFNVVATITEEFVADVLKISKLFLHQYDSNLLDVIKNKNVADEYG